MSEGLSVLPVEGLPEFHPGDDLAAAIVAAIDLADGDVVVVAQKVVSKVEGALVDPPAVPAGEDPRRALARREASEIVADSEAALIVRTKHGFVCANAGIDASNVSNGKLSLLPDDPDASADALRRDLFRKAGADVAVVIADTFGRPWRVGQTDVAIGLSGMRATRDERGRTDRVGHDLTVTDAAVADELAGAADLVRTKDAGVPVVVVRGFRWEPSGTAGAVDLVRDAETDLFRRGRGMLAAALADGPWPQRWSGGVAPHELYAARQVAPDLELMSEGPPTVLETRNQLAAGLAAAVLADAGLRVRWRLEEGRVILESGRPAPAG